MKQLHDYPLILKASQVAEILGIQKPTAYEYMRVVGFPTIEINGTKRVHRDLLVQWLEARALEHMQGA